MQDDGRLALAKSIPIAEVVDRLGIDGLRRTGAELVGPCPQCGGRDRFGVNVQSGVFNCRRCGRGGDGLALVEHVLGCDFKAALAFLAGEAEAVISPEEQARRRRRAAEAERRRQAEAERRRQAAIEDAIRIWRMADPIEGTAGARYLRRRGVYLDPPPKCFRYLSRHPYWHPIAGRPTKVHEGPCLVTAIQGPDARLTAVHQTWIDPAQDNGKAVILHPETGERLDAKKVRGSKKGAAIRLTGSLQSETLVMGEGIETTLSPLVAGIERGAMFWAGIDLGNMGGRQRRVPGKRYSGDPDLEDVRAFVPPSYVRRLVFLQDGDSDPAMTRAKLEAGLRRAAAHHPGLIGQIVHAGAGRDFNDIIRKDEVDHADERGADPRGV